MLIGSITSVVADDNPMRCITACASVTSGKPSLAIHGVTDLAAEEICSLVQAAALIRRFPFPKGRMTVELDFDVPFEKTSELAFAAAIAIANCCN